MKKPRKPRPKARQQNRTPNAAAVPRRAHAPPNAAIRLETLVLRSAGHHLTSAVTSGRRAFDRRFTEAAHLARKLAPHEVALRLRRLGAEARTLAVPYSRDEREALLLLFLPFLLVASAIVVHQSVRTLQSYLTSIAVPDVEIAPVGPGPTRNISVAALPRTVLSEASPARDALGAVRAAPETRAVTGWGASIETVPPAAFVKAVAPSEARVSTRTEGLTLHPAAPPSAARAPAQTRLALLAPARDLARTIVPLDPDAIESFEADESGKPIRPGICAVDQKPRTGTVALAAGGDPQSLAPEAFGLRLAKAAESQVDGFVIYNDAYRSMSYPMGDVNRLFGVCTDVVVRAYRALGLDLQMLVHQARAGTGDTNIDQRRTEVLRRFFAKEGESLPATTFPEDYRPGDIVTYYRPQNQRTRAHIAIVSSVIAPSGRPMIVHNRGWGPQLEDALFVDQITGHFRYRGPASTRNAAASSTVLASDRSDWMRASEAPVLPASYAIQSPSRR